MVDQSYPCSLGSQQRFAREEVFLGSVVTNQLRPDDRTTIAGDQSMLLTDNDEYVKNVLRKALGDAYENLVQTVRGTGYRFSTKA